MTITIATIIAALAGILLGALVCALIAKNKSSVLKTNLENISRQLEETKSQAKADAETAEARFRDRLAEVKADDEAMQTLKEHYDTSIREQQQRFDDVMTKMAEQSKAATEDLLKARQKEFAESSSTNIGQLVNPLKESIEKMEEEMRKSSEKAVAINSAMKENELTLKMGNNVRIFPLFCFLLSSLNKVQLP